MTYLTPLHYFWFLWFQILILQGLKQEVTCLCPSPDGLHLAVGYEDGSIRIFSLLSGEGNVTFSGHKAAITSLKYDRSTAETRQNDAERPVSEEPCLAHWYAQLPEMKRPAQSERKLPGSVWRREAHSSQSTGSCLAEAGKGGWYTEEWLPPWNNCPSAPSFWSLAKLGSPFPFAKEETQKGVLSSLLEGMLIMLLFLFFFFLRHPLYLGELAPMCIGRHSVVDKPLGVGHWGKRNMSALRPCSLLKPIVK